MLLLLLLLLLLSGYLGCRISGCDGIQDQPPVGPIYNSDLPSVQYGALAWKTNLLRGINNVWLMD